MKYKKLIFIFSLFFLFGCASEKEKAINRSGIKNIYTDTTQVVVYIIKNDQGLDHILLDIPEWGLQTFTLKKGSTNRGISEIEQEFLISTVNNYKLDQMIPPKDYDWEKIEETLDDFEVHMDSIFEPDTLASP
jgi:hypothetical protein